MNVKPPPEYISVIPFEQQSIGWYKLKEDSIIPKKATTGSAGYDLYSTQNYTLKPGERYLFKLGIAVVIPAKHYGRIAPRSSLAYKYGIDVLAGVIDSDYRDELGVILLNTGKEDYTIQKGDRIAQLVVEKVFEYYDKELNQDEWLHCKILGREARKGGYGSTGV